MACDVFISYRHADGADPAKALYIDLKNAGYEVFCDDDSLHSGRFDTAIEENIRTCTDFLLLVTNELFSERIFSEDDWVRKEINLAIKYKKNIIPVFYNGNKIPDSIPDDVAAVSRYNGVEAYNHSKIIGFLQSKPKKNKNKNKIIVLAVVVLAIIVLAVSVVSKLGNEPDNKELTENQTNSVSVSVDAQNDVQNNAQTDVQYNTQDDFNQMMNVMSGLVESMQDYQNDLLSESTNESASEQSPVNPATNQIPEKYEQKIEALKYMDAQEQSLYTLRMSVGGGMTPNAASGWGQADIYSQNTDVAVGDGLVVKGVSKGETYVIVAGLGSMAVAYRVIVE